MTIAIIALAIIAAAALISLAMTIWFPPPEGSGQYWEYTRKHRKGTSED